MTAFIVIQVFLFQSTSLFAQLGSTPWPMFMYDIRHTGKTTSTGTGKNTLYWKYSIGSTIEASPVIGADGTVYVGDTDGYFYAISQDGEKNWTYETDGEIYAAAAVDKNNVIYVGSEDAYLYALNSDGTRKWRYKASVGISSSPVINPNDGAIYFGAEDKYLYALDTTGSLKWKSILDEEIWDSPAFYNDVIYVGTIGGVIYAINASDGSQKWSYDTKSFIIGSPSIDSDPGLVLIGTDEGVLYALNIDDGLSEWTYTTGGAISSTPAINAATDVNAIYVGAEDGNLYAIDRTSGTLKWKYETGNDITSSPAVDGNGVIYFGSKDNKVYAVSSDATLKWSYTTNDEVVSSPAIGSDGLTYICSKDGNLYSIGSEKVGTVTADFTANPTSGEVPLTVQFTDQSVGDVYSWQWDFGDGNSSTTQNPSHTYYSAGEYPVSLTVTGSGVSDTETKEGYISVSKRSSEITNMSASPSELTFGETLTISGNISPPHEATVTITLTNEDGETETETADAGANGSFSLNDYYPTDGGLWTVVASWDGDSDHYGAESDEITFSVSQATPAITIEASSSTVVIGETVDISGIVTLTPDNDTTRNEFIGEDLKLVRIDPEGSYEDIIETQPYLSGDQIQYKFEDVKLPDQGTWELLVGFDKTESFNGTNSASIKVEVQELAKDVAGYAILVEGRVKDKSGIDSHNLTINYIYEKLIERGFTDDNIYYFNFDESKGGVDKKPSKDDVLDTIKTWASDKMNDSPAPLYIVFIGHGEKEKFPVYPDTLKAKDISDALSELESQLNTSASEEPIVIVFGANRSGGFINSLSKSGTNRVIITSSDTEEISYKGPLPPDETVRQGDYFAYEFFKYAANGESLKKSYETASDKIADFTENENGNGLNGASAGNGQYSDSAAQHPLLDDNGDGVGTHGELSSISGKDGALAGDIVVGVGTPTTMLELTQVSDTITLEEDAVPTLYAKVNDTSRVDAAWVSIASPGHSLKNNKGATEQQVIKLPRFSYNDFNETDGKYLWNDFSSNEDFNNFADAGGYEVFYFARNSETGDFASLMESDVFKNKADNLPPSTFSPISPEDGTETAIALSFDWDDSSDPDTSSSTVRRNVKNAGSASGGGLTYTLTIAEDSNFQSIIYKEKGITDSFHIVDKTAGLRDGTTYYWSVIAIDADGGVTYFYKSSGTSTATSASKLTKELIANAETSITGTSSSFTPKLANGYSGFVKGYIYDNDTSANISDATITVEGMKGSYSSSSGGAYFIELASGNYTLSVDASGYDTATKSVSISSWETVTENIGMTVSVEPASIFGNIKDKKKGKPIEDVSITVKKKGFTETTTTDSNGDYTVTDLESGTYKFVAKKSGYNTYKKKIKLKAGQDKELNFKMKKK